MIKKVNLVKCALAAFVCMTAAVTQSQAQFSKDTSKFLGNIMYQGQVSVDFDKYWNQITPAASGKWQACEPTDGDFNNWLWLDRAYNHAKQVGIPFKEHCLIWGVDSSKGGAPGYISRLTDTAQIRARIVRWFDTLSKRYPAIDLIDVVNEPTHVVPTYIDAIGGSGTTGWDWVIWCYKQARIYFPNSKLLLNDYNLLNYTDQCSAFLKIARLLKDSSLIDGISCQGHSLESISMTTIQKNLDSLTSLGIDFYVSELEIDTATDSIQQRMLAERFKLLWENSNVKGITMWGYVKGQMWESKKNAHLITTDGTAAGTTERPAFTWLKEYFNYTGDSVQYVFKTAVDGNGTLTLNPSDSSYAPFASVVATATPDDGYTFTGWTGDIGGTTNPYTMSMYSNRMLTAHFTASTAVSSAQKVASAQQIQLKAEGQNITVTIPALKALASGSRVDVSIFNMQGKQVWKDSYTATASGSTLYSGHFKSISGGSYLAQIKINGVVAQRSSIVLAE